MSAMLEQLAKNRRSKQADAVRAHGRKERRGRALCSIGRPEGS
jgi:hypothetical protein